MTGAAIARGDARKSASSQHGPKIATLLGMPWNRVVTIALFVSLVASTAFATPVTYQSPPTSTDDGGVATAPYDEAGESDTSVLFDQSGAPLLWVSTPIYLRLPIFGAGAYSSDNDQPGLSWVPGGSGSGPGTGETPPGSQAPPPPGADLPGDDVPGNDDFPGDEVPPRDDQPPVDDVPEPATLMLLSPAVMLLMRRRRQLL
jgi:hypothetical protein